MKSLSAYIGVPFDPYYLIDPPGDFVPDSIEALVLFCGLAALVAITLSNSRQENDPFAAIEAQALKFSHKKSSAPQSIEPGQPSLCASKARDRHLKMLRAARIASSEVTGRVRP